jgi:hypothetical protein
MTTNLSVELMGELVSRWRWPVERPDFAAAAKVHKQALDCVVGLTAKRAEFAESGDLTQVGQNRAIREWVKKHQRVEMIRNVPAVARAREQIAAERAALTQPHIDRADLAGELQRQELRILLRDKPVGERVKLALADTEVATAILSASPLLTGLPTDARERISEAYAVAQHSERLAQLDEAEEALHLAEQAHAFATGQIKAAAGLDDASYGLWWTTAQDPGQPLTETMMRTEFNALDPLEQAARIHAGQVIVD